MIRTYIRPTLCALFLLLLPLAGHTQRNHLLEVAKQLEIYNALYKDLDLYYVDTLQAEDVVPDAINYMLSQLDPYTEYYPADKREDLQQLTTGKYAGIGAYIRYYKPQDAIAIAEPFKGTPAALAGLQAGDVLLRIDGEEIKKKGDQPTDEYVAQVSQRLRGTPGSKVEIQVRRPGIKKTMLLTITRQRIQQPAISYQGMINPQIGYIALREYTEGAAQHVHQAVQALQQQGATSLVLDLRGNGGGLLSEAIKIVNLFVPRNKLVVRTQGKVAEASQSFYTAYEPFDVQMPLVVLVDTRTASAAEITSGALQDYDRAVILGQQTFGKGLVQQPRELPYGTMVKLTTAKYYIPSGRCVQRYDFKHRAADGTATTLPDSLAQVFHTVAGRPVKDSGGITPDVIIPTDSLPTLLAYLSVSDVVFDYANHYHATHPQVAPAATFSITQAEYQDFIDRVLQSDFTYDKQSLKLLETLRKVAAVEGYAKESAAAFAALEQKLSHNTEYDLRHWQVPITRLLNAEIVRRYYYEQGVVAQQITVDKEVKKAIMLLLDNAAYKRLLHP